MTAPHQPLPTTLESLLGLGAFQVADGGSTQYGQSGINTDFVHSLIGGPLSGFDFNSIADVPAALAKLAEYLLTLPLEALQLFKNFIPGTSMLDFTDHPTAVGTITGALNVNPLGPLLGGFGDLNGSFNQIQDILGGLFVTPINPSVGLVKDWFNLNTSKTTNLTSGGELPPTNVTGLLDKLKDGAAGTTGSSGTSLAGMFSALQGQRTSLDATTTQSTDWVTGFFNGVSGRAETGITAADASTQAGELASTVASLSGAVSALQTSSDGTANSGLSGGDLFEVDYASNLGGTGEWTETYLSGTSADGFMYVSGGEARWSRGTSTSDREGRFRRTNPLDQITQTDYQKLIATIGSQVADWAAFGTYAKKKFLVRCNTAETQYVFVELTATGGNTVPMKAQFGYRNGGSETLVGSPVNCTQAAANRFEVVAGTSGGVRQFQFKRNGSVILNWNDSGALSAYGPSNRGWGFGERGTPHGSGSSTQTRPSSSAAITIADNTPVAVVGTTMRVYRSSTSAVAVSTGDNPIPSGVFDTTDYITPDLSFNSSTNEITVAKAGTYLCSMRLLADSDIGMGNLNRYLLWYVGGSLKSVGADQAAVSANGAGVPALSRDRGIGGDAFTYYVPAGGVIRAGCGVSSGIDIIGNSGGTQTWLSITKIG